MLHTGCLIFFFKSSVGLVSSAGPSLPSSQNNSTLSTVSVAQPAHQSQGRPLAVEASKCALPAPFWIPVVLVSSWFRHLQPATKVWCRKSCWPCHPSILTTSECLACVTEISIHSLELPSELCCHNFSLILTHINVLTYPWSIQLHILLILNTTLLSPHCHLPSPHCATPSHFRAHLSRIFIVHFLLPSMPSKLDFFW